MNIAIKSNAKEASVSVPAQLEEPGQWRAPLLWIILPLLVGSMVFWLTDLDRQVIGLFYTPEGTSHAWPLSQTAFWQVVYESAPYLTGFLAAVSLGVIAFGFSKPLRRRFRIYGLFMLLSVAVGPGLLVNAVLKDNYGRPRPSQTVEFGGPNQFHPLLVPGERGVGKSFPSGHSSVGFVFVLFWFLWRKHRPGLATAALFAALLLGGLLGFQRMSSGSHFPSDVLWSAGVCLLVCHGLYYFVLQIPRREAVWLKLESKKEKSGKRPAVEEVVQAS